MTHRDVTGLFFMAILRVDIFVIASLFGVRLDNGDCEHRLQNQRRGVEGLIRGSQVPVR